MVKRTEMPFTYKIAASSNLKETVSDSSNMLIINSDEFKVQDQNGIVVAEIKDGRLTAKKQDIYQFRPTDLRVDEEKNDSQKKTLIYLPTDAYMIKNTDDSIDKLEIGMVDENQSVNVTTTADDVTVHVNDREKCNVVNIHADNSDSYEVVLNSSLESAKDMEEITVSGTAAKNTVEVGVTANGCVLKNCTDIQMKINGKEPGSTVAGGQADISKAEASLEYASCDYDGKNKEPEVIIKTGSSLLKNGTDYVVVYRNNIEPGIATATVYGIANYAGTISLDFKIKGKDSNAALTEAKNQAKKELSAYKKPGDYREVQKKELTASERFTGMVINEFQGNIGQLNINEYQKQLIRNYFIGIDNALKIAEERRSYSKKKANDPAIIWQNVNMNKLSVDVVQNAKLGLDMAVVNHLSVVPYLNGKTNKYDLNLMPGYEGLRYVSIKYAIYPIIDIRVELIHKNDKFKNRHFRNSVLILL